LPLPCDAVAFAIIGLGMAAATVVDLRTRRIPNLITAPLAVIGLSIAAAGYGRLSLAASLLGVIVGLGFMLPGHLVGATGAGDVKLFAAAGSLLGPVATVHAFLYTAIAGGVLALVVAMQRRRVWHTVGTTARLATGDRMATAEIESPDTDNRFAYGPAIAVGVVLAAWQW